MDTIPAIIFGIIGIVKFNDKKEKNRWQAIVGLSLGILFLLTYVAMYAQ